MPAGIKQTIFLHFFFSISKLGGILCTKHLLLINYFSRNLNSEFFQTQSSSSVVWTKHFDEQSESPYRVIYK